MRVYRMKHESLQDKHESLQDKRESLQEMSGGVYFSPCCVLLRLKRELRGSRIKMRVYRMKVDNLC